jgi:hypothetical protein
MPRREIISRKAWGAKAPKNVTRTKWYDGMTLWVHHSESPAPSPDADRKKENAVMQGIQNFHMGPSRGWSDIGYHYVIMPSGRVYEGRGYGVIGAHCPGHNAEPSVCIIGSYDAHTPTNEALRSLNWLSDELAVKKLKGHRDGFSTSCPGNALYQRIKFPLPAWKTTDPKADVKKSVRVQVMDREWVGWDSAKGAIKWIAGNGLRAGTKASITWNGHTWTGAKAVTNVCRNIYTNWIQEEL